MNEEVGRINELKGLVVSNKSSVNRISNDVLKDLQYQMNINMAKLYDNGEKLKINEYIDAFVENIYIILNMISEMHLTPEYFFNIVLKANNDFMEFSKKHPDLLPGEARKAFAKQYSIFYVHDDILHAIYYGNYKKEATNNGEDHNIDYYFMRIVEQYQKNKISYGNTSIYQCQKSFLLHYIDIINIMHDFYNCDDMGDEVECMMNLLYEYLCFFVEIGVNPKIYLDEYIEDKTVSKKK